VNPGRRELIITNVRSMLSRRACHRTTATAIGTVALLFAIALAGCGRGEPPRPAGTSAPVQPPPAERDTTAAESPRRDLSIDESMGGHTLTRHVGKTNRELAERLRREPQITSASTYSDRTTAEQVVGSALGAAGQRFDTWRARSGRRPNFVLHYSAGRDIGRSLSRRRSSPMPCERAVVVLRWDDRHDRFYVLTSYPEQGR
jgi:hypothetical protein